MAALQWQLCNGRSAMAAMRWQLSIGIIIVIDMLWWHCYDIYTLAALLWRLCFGGYTLAAMLWRQSCHGNKLQKATDILIHITITTFIVITTVTTITIIYSCLQPIQRFSRTVSKSRVEDEWFGKTFLALMIWKTPYSHFRFHSIHIVEKYNHGLKRYR